MGRMTSYPGSFRKRRHAAFGAPPCMKTERSCTYAVLNANDLRLFSEQTSCPFGARPEPQKARLKNLANECKQELPHPELAREGTVDQPLEIKA